MRIVTATLVALLVLVHAQLWLGKGGVPKVLELSAQVAEQRTGNEAKRLANARLAAEVRDLQEGLEMIEEKARSELGMVKPDEILVQYASANRAASSTTTGGVLPVAGPTPAPGAR